MKQKKVDTGQKFHQLRAVRLKERLLTNCSKTFMKRLKAVYPYGGKTMRQVIIYPGEDGYWVAECPSLPGCISQGKTKQEAVANIKEAIEGYVLSLEEDGLPIPDEHFEALVLAV